MFNKKTLKSVIFLKKVQKILMQTNESGGRFLSQTKFQCSVENFQAIHYKRSPKLRVFMMKHKCIIMSRIKKMFTLCAHSQFASLHLTASKLEDLKGSYKTVDNLRFFRHKFHGNYHSYDSIFSIFYHQKLHFSAAILLQI